jgi:hypothetical protein
MLLFKDPSVPFVRPHCPVFTSSKCRRWSPLFCHRGSPLLAHLMTSPLPCAGPEEALHPEEAIGAIDTVQPGHDHCWPGSAGQFWCCEARPRAHFRPLAKGFYLTLFHFAETFKFCEFISIQILVQYS